MITQERLKAVLNYNPLTGVFVWRATGREAGCVNGRGYHQISVDRKRYYSHRLAWLYMFGRLPDKTIDHINRNKLDNRISNLRDVCQTTNNTNKPLQRNNSTGVSGVVWHSSMQKYQVRIGVAGVRKSLGYTKDFFEACCIRYAAILKYWPTT